MNLSADNILQVIDEAGIAGRTLNPQMWLDIAHRLQVLLGAKANALEDMRQEVAKKKLEFLADMDRKNVAAADAMVEATDIYRDMKKLEWEVKRIEGFTNIAKLNARTAQGI